jgi:hypothetical protein
MSRLRKQLSNKEQIEKRLERLNGFDKLSPNGSGNA